MVDYIICTRAVKGGKFIAEPGGTYFLEVPESAIEHSPSNGFRSSSSGVAGKKGEYFEKIQNEALTEQGPSDISGSCGGDVVVFIHGYNNSLETVLNRHRELKAALQESGYKGAVVSFDWPSDDKVLNYLEDRTDAKMTAIKLVDDCIKAFSVITTQDCQINVHMLAHSTGAYVVREAFDDADDRPSVAASSWTVSQIMFIGADVSANSMSKGNPKTASLYRRCVRLTNYSSPFDIALKLSNMKRLGVAPRVGRIGLPEEIPSNAVNVNCSEYYDENKSQLDAIGEKTHSWHIGDKMFTKDMLLTIRGDIDRHKIPTRYIENGQLYLSASL